MKTTISVRHTEITDDLRQRTNDVLERLGSQSPHALEATVVFDLDGLNHQVEIRLHARGGHVLVGTGEGPDHRTALDRAEDKVRRQLERDGGGARRARRAAKPRP
ncbi:MAG: HPF/RaiA family ribosome-associated protein [Gemmatimonadales bacterium]